MTDNQLQHQDLGYVFVPFESRSSIGFHEMIVNITREPSESHFDPVEMSMRAAGQDTDFVEHHTIFHPYTFGSSLRLIPGKICIKDRKGKRVEVFCFGGTLTIDSKSDGTQCHLVSKPPILYPNHAGVTVQDLEDEIQILLARRRAAWIARGEEAFETKMLEIDPSLLCAACLAEIVKEFNDQEMQSLGTNRRLMQVVRKEISDLKAAEQWPASVPPIEEIL